MVDHDRKRALRIENWINDPSACTPGEVSTEVCPSFGDFKDSILPLYYYAKNQAYGHENYYDEMKKIQSRLEFSRSISMLAFIYLCLGVLFVIPLLIKFRREHSPQMRRRIYVRVPAVLLILFGIFFFSLWAYERESDEFNKRAFGYFSSMLMAEKNKAREENPTASVLTATPHDVMNHHRR